MPSVWHSVGHNSAQEMLLISLPVLSIILKTLANLGDQIDLMQIYMYYLDSTWVLCFSFFFNKCLLATCISSVKLSAMPLPVFLLGIRVFLIDL